jgi:hypothetical protein
VNVLRRGTRVEATRPGADRRIGAGRAPVWAVASAVAVHLVAAVHLGGRAPGDGEARLAAAVYAVGGGPVGPVPLPFPDLLAAHQLAVVTALMPGNWSVWTTAQVGVLVCGLLTAVLLWPVLRRLGCGSGPTALGVALVGLTPPAVALHSSVVATAVAVPWLLVAAVVVGRSRLRRGAAVVAVLVAVLTAPLLGTAVLALAAYAIFDGTVSRRPGRGLRTAAGLAVGVVAVVLAIVLSGYSTGAAAARGAVATVVVAGVVLVVAGWRVRWARPLLGPAVLLLVVAVVPGPGRVAAALAVLPFLAVVLAVVAEEATARMPRRLRWPVPALLAGATAAASVLLLLPVPGRTTEPTPALLLGWMDDQMAPGTALHADALDRAELIEAGFPAERLRGLDGPVAADEAVLLSGGSCPVGELRASLPWRGGAAALCGAADPVATDDAERAGRTRIGAALAGNRGLQLDPAAADLLATGRVDPRVMMVLSVLAGSHALAVSDFPSAPFEPADTLRRRVVVGSVDGLPATSAGPAFLQAWLEGQHAPFVPTVVRPQDGGLLIGYRAPTPAGLLPG